MVVLKDIRKSHLEALLDYMYVGEVDVKQSELAGLIKAAECLRIKGLAVPDEDPSAGGSSKNQKKVSNNNNTSSSNSDNVSDSANRRTGGAGAGASGSGNNSSPPPRKRQRKDSGDKGGSDFSSVKENSGPSFSRRGGNESTTSVPSQQSSSLKRRISPERDDDEPEILPVDQIKVERDDQSGGPSNVDDGSGRGGRGMVGQGSEGDGMGGSNTGHDDDQGDYSTFSQDDIEKQEHDQDIDQMNSYTDSMEAGPSGMQEVGFCDYFCLFFVFRVKDLIVILIYQRLLSCGVLWAV